MMRDGSGQSIQVYTVVASSNPDYIFLQKNEAGACTMSQSAYIMMVEGSSVPSLTLDELKEQLLHYKEQLALTGKQLSWEYEDYAFPYTIETKPDSEGKWFYLKGTTPSYKYIIMGLGSKTEDEQETNYVHVVLPDDCTYGDKSKGNEICKHLARSLKAKLIMFNGRTMYFNPRK